MKLLKKLTAVTISSVCTLSTVFFSANAETYQYQRQRCWYYSDEVSFLCSDYDADDSNIDFYGLTPENVFVSGQTSYDVTFNVNGTDKAFNVKIGALGDANMDGVLNACDAAVIAKNAATGKGYKSGFNMFLADFDKSGSVSVSDAALISKKLAEDALKKAELQQQIKNERAERILELVNAERKKAGLNELILNNNLSKMSEKRAKEISVNFNHIRPDGSSWNTALDEYHIAYRYAGENIAAGYNSPEAVVDGWMNSEGHRANILDPDFTEMGIGYYTDSSMYKYYWAQNFIRGK